MKLTDDELDWMLGEADLELAQPYAKNGKYRKDEYFLTRCKICGTVAHYRLKYILDKNEVGERVCRACYWSQWYGDTRALVHSAIKHLLDKGANLDDLVDQGVVTAREATSFSDAKRLANEHGYELVDLLTGERPGEELLVVRCKACGRQTVERPEDVTFGCSCRGKAKGVLIGEEKVKVQRSATPVASGRYQDGTERLLVRSGAECLGWWDIEANGEVPEDLTCLSRREYQWKCPECGCRFRAPVYIAYSYLFCPNCVAWSIAESDAAWEILSRMTAMDFPDLLAAWDDVRDPRTVPLTSDQIVHLRCPEGHHTAQTLYSHLTRGCGICEGLATRQLRDKDRQYLATTDPELAAEWVRPRDGGNWTPYNVGDGSKRTIVWRCIACGHMWEATVHARQLRMNNRCPACDKVMGSLAWKYPQLAAEWSPNNPISPWNIKPFSKLDFTPEWVCSKNPEHVWRMTTNTRINKGRGCPFCEKEKNGQS
jgi:hypothetical protein